MNNISLFREDITDCLDEFHELYKNRLIKDNSGGMKSPHMFASWYIIKKLQPTHIIESGVFKGAGTWFMERASNAQITSIDPAPQCREYTSDKAVYLTKDFSQCNWSGFPRETTLCFFDDHQDALDRLTQCYDFGFKHLIFEDNYPADQGDCYSIKKILSCEKWVIDKDGHRAWFASDDEDFWNLFHRCEQYQEFPPIFKDDMTRWGTKWDYETKRPLLSEQDKDKYPIFWEEKLYYTWLCYITLRDKNDR